MLPDLDSGIPNLGKDRRTESGLFWQTDVKDGMEESLSGGSREQNASPTINSYMFGNAKALSAIAALKGDRALAGIMKVRPIH
jgi:hypothetical protein